MGFSNSYEDARRAEAYARLEFKDTYYLAYRDLPEIIYKHAAGKRAIDFGCGTGRSTRFLQKLGFDVVGIDIAENMINKAKKIDPQGDYRLITGDDLSQIKYGRYDIVLSVFTFDNIPTREEKEKWFSEIGKLLNDCGKLVNLVSSPEIYLHEWASFSTRDYPENKYAKSGDKVKIIITGIGDNRPVEDVVWADDAYKEVFAGAGLNLLETYNPLARDSEPYNWVNETRIAPWIIYVLENKK